MFNLDRSQHYFFFNFRNHILHAKEIKNSFRKIPAFLFHCLIPLNKFRIPWSFSSGIPYNVMGNFGICGMRNSLGE